MKLNPAIISLISIIFTTIPFILFYYAFYSGNSVFKNSVNDHVELFYLLFIILSFTFSILFTKSLIDHNKISTNTKVLLLLFFKIIIVIYAVILVFNTTSRFNTYRSEAIDVRFFREELWQMSSFEIPQLQWAQHFSPIFYFLVPLFWVVKNGAFLMFIQALFVVSGAVPLYFSAKEKLKSQFLGLSIITAYLTFGGLQFGFAYGFHEIMFLPPLLFWAYYFLIKKRIKLYFLFILLSLFVKEEVSFIMIFWGIYLIYKKNYPFALGTLVLGVFWYILCFYIIFPYFNHGKGFGYWGQYSNGANGILGIVMYSVSHPFEFIKSLLNPKYKIDTILHSFGNFSFLSFLYPPSLIIVIPSLFEKLLSSNIAAKNGFHYSSAITAVSIISTIESIFYIQKRKIFSKIVKNRNNFLGIIILYVAVSANLLYGYHPLSPLLIGKERGLTDGQVMILNRALDLIPPAASVAAQYHIGSHIDKPYWLIHDGPGDNETADYAIINTDLNLIMSEREYLEKSTMKLLKDNKYEVILNEGGTILFKRK